MTYIMRARHSPARFFRGAPQFIELKQIGDIEARIKDQCRAAIRSYRHSRWEVNRTDDPLERHYRSIEAALSRRHAADAVRLYALLRRDVRRSFRKYIEAAFSRKY